MSQLLWGTLLLGLLVLAAVGAYSWWDIRRARQKLLGTTPKSQAPRGSGLTYMANHQEPGGDTTIMDTRIEPQLHDDEPDSAEVTSAEPSDTLDIPAYERLRGQTASTVLATTLASADETKATDALEEPQQEFDDAAIVSTAFIEYANPVSAQALLQHLPGSRRAGSKPVEVHACVEANDEWEDINPQHSYRAVRLTVLLANRQGPLNEMDYSEFAALVQRLAEATGGEAEFDDMLDAVKRARELDEFAATHDALITLCLRAKGTAWSANFVQQNAASLGFVPGQVPGRMIKLHASSEPLVALQFDAQAAMAAPDDMQQQALSIATLVLDVPQAPQALQPLTALKESAAALARKLDASITDEDGRPLTDETWLALSGQLSGLYEALERKGLTAGHAAARRVYS
jgi:ZipA, C-terminal FtsZ-binding domain